MDIFEEKDIHPEIVCLNEDARTTAAWAEAGMGIGIMPSSALSMLKKEDTVSVEIDDSRIVSEIYLITHKNSYRSPIALGFWNFVRDWKSADS